MSSASSSFISTFQPAETEADTESDPLPLSDATIPGDLPLVPALLDAFQASLIDYGISLRFFSGSWETFDPKLTEQPYDIVLTSETIYRTESLAALCDLMWKACTASGRTSQGLAADMAESIEDFASQLSLSSQPSRADADANQQGLPVCVVAAKMVYFGVGGGVSDFTRAIESGTPSSCSRREGKVETMWKKDEGVKRVIMAVHWD
jgi:protein-histidine N-methyltransferase